MLFQEAVAAAPYAGLVPWVVILPVIGLIANLIIGKYIGEAGVGAVASLASGGAFIVAVLLAVGLSANPEPTNIPFLQWMVIGPLSVNWGFRVDTLSVTMMLVVAGVGTLIHIYAIGYMHQDVRHNGDPGRFRRFFVYLNLFIAAMMILVSADNYLMMFVGWEGVGLCSYLLIGFWFEKGAGGIANAQAAKKAFVVNRIGDFGLLIALFLIYWNFGSFQYSAVFEQAAALEGGTNAVIVAITLFMLLGVTGKSAQLPLYVWLPDAMAGPTPVSALIHAATMVTAGVYLVARSFPFYEVAPSAQSLVAWVGAITALFAATIAMGQFDIKRVLAYSTISQLGFMVAAVGLGAYVAGMFHLITHAFFKALLFLSAGSVILGMEGGQEAAYGHNGHGSAKNRSHGRGRGRGAERAPAGSEMSHQEEDHVQGTSPGGPSGHGDFDPQDMRNMGGLRGKMPVTSIVYLIGVLAIAGIAPFSGFFSKDEILAAATQQNLAIFIILAVTAFLTAYYMGRQYFMVFSGGTRTRAAGAATESGPLITIPLIILAVLSVVGGALNIPGVYTLEHWLEHTIEAVTPVAFNILLAAAALLVAVVGLVVAWVIYARRPAARAQFADPFAEHSPAVFKALNAAWWVDDIYNTVFVGGYRALARFLSGAVDQTFIDGIVNGMGYIQRGFAQLLRQVQNGFVRSYALIVLLGAVVMLGYLIFWQMR